MRSQVQGFLTGWTVTASKNAGHGAAVKTIRQNWLELSKTRHHAASQMPGRIHALVQNAHDINGVVNCAVINPVMLDRQDLKGWFHRRTARGRIVQNNVQRVIDTGAVFCQLRFPPSGERVGENVTKILFCLLR